MASVASGVSRIYGYAREPHVISLVEFLRRAGAIVTVFDDYVEVVGAKLSDSYSKIIPDMIEAGTYLALSLMTDSELRICGSDSSHLASFLDLLAAGGAKLSEASGAISAVGGLSKAIDVSAEPYPAFPTDLQPQMAPLFARFCGGSITDKVWRSRFGYLSQLSHFGIRYELFDGGAKIYPSDIRPASAAAPDLRGGAALVMAALFARGESIIDGSEIIRRGYGDIVNKLRAVGADIKEL